MPRKRNADSARSKISKIEKDLSINIDMEDESVADTSLLIEAEFDSSAFVEKIDKEIAEIQANVSKIDDDLKTFAAELQEQLSARQAQAEEEKSGLLLRVVEMNGVKKYLNNELF